MTEFQRRASDKAADATAINPGEHRRARRRQVLKRAQLIFGLAGSTIDCLILDESPLGVLLETPVMTDFPERLRIRFVGGATFDALRQWSMGNKIGLEFVGPQILDEEMLRRKQAIKFALETQGLDAALKMLQANDFFKSDTLRAAAEAAEIVVSRLSALL